MNTESRPTQPVSADELARRQAKARLSAEEKKNNKARFIALGGVGLAAVLGGGAAAYAATHISEKPDEEEEEIVIGEPAEPQPAPAPAPQPAPAPAPTRHAAPAQPAQPEEPQPEEPKPEEPKPEEPKPEEPKPEEPKPEEPKPEEPKPEEPKPEPPTPVDENHVEAIAFVDDAGTVWVRIDNDKYANEQGDLWTEELAENHVVVAFMPNANDTYVLVDPATASYARHPDGDKIVQLTPPATPDSTVIDEDDEIVVEHTDDVLADNTKGEEQHTDDHDDDTDIDDDTDDDIVIVDDDPGLPQYEPDIEVEIITEDITLEDAALPSDIADEPAPLPDDPEPADPGNDDLAADL